MKESLIYKSGNIFLELNERPYLLTKLEGADGLKNSIYSTKGIEQDGYTITGTSIDERALSIQGYIFADTTEIIEIYKRKLLTLFNPKEKGTLYYNIDGTTKSIDVIVEGAPIFEKDKTKRTQKYIIDLVAPDPYWIDGVTKVNMAEWKGGFHFPLSINKGIIMGYKEPSLIVNAYNDGDVETGIIIEFKAKGSVVNPSLFNVNTREFIKLNTVMEAGEIINICTEYGKKKIIRNLNGDESDYMNKLDINSTFLKLQVGDNLFRYDADSNLNNLEISVYFNRKYVGV